MALYQKQLFGTDGFVILTEGKVPGHLTRLDDKGAFPREYAALFTAAPDLLAALTAIDAMWSECDGERVDPIQARSGRVREVWESARAVIAKAGGAA